jgi:hypothetical protein
LKSGAEAGKNFLAEAEPLLRQSEAGFELAQLLCARVELEHGSGNLDVARDALVEAEALGHRLGAGPDSETGRSIAMARQIIGAASGVAMPGA